APDGGYDPYVLQVLTCREGAVARITAFRDLRLFAVFGLPARLPAGAGGRDQSALPSWMG
ncbi:MAG: hypothetical protein HOY69_05320, partial [Streptomyces sp.]|nr:hypothetical protein [Streptomyces sp.]